MSVNSPSVDTNMVVADMFNWLKEYQPDIYEEYLKNQSILSDTSEVVINTALEWNKYYGANRLVRSNNLDLIALDSNEINNNLTTIEEQFVDIAIIGDTEFDMRGNQDSILNTYAQRAANIDSMNLKHKASNFTAAEIALNHDDIKTPELVFLAGDCNRDRAGASSINKVHTMLDYFENMGSTVIVGEGNHDWEPRSWGDEGWGWTISGSWNAHEVWTNMVLPYRDIIANDPVKFPNGVYSTSWSSTISTSPLNYYFYYKNILFGNFNTFLGEKRGQMSFGSFFDAGPAWFSTTPFELAMYNLLSQHTSTPKVFVQHYPLTTGDHWWDEGRNPSVGSMNKSNFKLALTNNNATLFTAHRHYANKVEFPQNDFVDYTTGAFSYGRILYVKISSTRGVIAVTSVNLRLNTVDQYLK